MATSGEPPAGDPARQTFRTTILSSGKTATGIVVPPDIVGNLGQGKRPRVKVTIGAHTYRSTIAVMGGQFMVGVSAENRERAGVAGGDDVEVTLELDTAPREIDVPPDLAAALRSDATVQRAFDGLSYSGKQRHVLAVEGAKTEQTRQRRIAKVVEALTDPPR
jgi:hypothetical protein